MTKRSGRATIERWLCATTAVIAMSGAAACSDATAVRGGANQLAFSLAPQQSSGATTNSAVVPVTKNGHTLDLTKVSVTVERAKLKPVHDDVCEDDDDQGEDHHGDNSGPGRSGGDDDCAVVKLGPATVDLPLSGNVVSVPADAFPAGTFHELEVRVSQLHLVGTFDGTAFDVTLPVNVKTEIEFETPLVVTAGTATSITVNVPVGDWFVNADGSLVDPSKVATTPSLLAQLRNRIAASLRAFEDRDHDGHDDRHGRGPG